MDMHNDSWGLKSDLNCREQPCIYFVVSNMRDWFGKFCSNSVVLLSPYIMGCPLVCRR
jgi:hypothetical protein